MKSENQNNSLFRPLKKASTVALIAVALFASAAHADLGEKLGAQESIQIAQDSLNLSDQGKGKPAYYDGQKGSFTKLVVVDGKGNQCTVEALRLTKKNAAGGNHLVKSAACFYNDPASLAK